MTFIIAEVAQAHDGSLGTAHSYIQALAEVGVDAVKFQAHLAEYESTLDENFRIKMSGQDDSRYAYWKRMEFTPDQWHGIRKHCDDVGIEFICSPFSIPAVDMLIKLGMRKFKLGSGEMFNYSLIKHIAGFIPDQLILSTGLSTWTDIDQLIEFLTPMKTKYALLQCTTKYPTPLSEIGLTLMQAMMKRYNCPIGLSDHSANVNTGIAAVSLNANIFEAHAVFDRRQYGPDSSSSLTIDEFKQIVEYNSDFNKLMNPAIDKNNLDELLTSTKSLFSKSVTLTQDMPKGTILTIEMLSLKKPAGGINPEDIESVVGKQLTIDWPSNKILSWACLK